ncbi:DUF6643 family protein [Streptomyces sp. NPDC001274]
MTSPRSTFGGGYYAAPSFPDTPIYDSLVAERGTPQIAPIRVPAAYDTGNSYLPALPAALPALPAAPTPTPPAPSYGYPQPAPPQGYAPAPPAPLQHAPAPYIPQQPAAARGGYPAPHPQQPQRPAPGTGYEAMTRRSRQAHTHPRYD